LIETCHLTFFDAYLENIKEVCNLDEIDYIILNHNEPGPFRLAEKAYRLMPGAQVCFSGGGYLFKEHHQQAELQYKIVKDGETIDLGRENTAFYQRAIFALARFHVHMVEESVLFSPARLSCATTANR
jgi:flavorubredoxin